jgi:hypothetical protein
MIGNNTRLTAKKSEIQEKFPCFRFKEEEGQSLIWSLYKLDYPDFYVSTQKGDANVFLVRVVSKEGHMQYCCITVGCNAFGAIIPSEVASRYDQKVEASVRQPIKEDERRIAYDTTVITRGVDYSYYALILHDMLGRMIKEAAEGMA